MKFLLVLSFFCVFISGCASTQKTQPITPIEEQNSQEAIKLAHIMRDNGRYEAAAGIYKSMDQKGELSGAYLIEYASLSSILGNHAEVIPIYKRAQDELADNITPAEQEAICEGMGKALLNLGHYSQAESKFLCAKRLNTNNLIALNGLAVINNLNGNYAQATQQLENALIESPENEMIINNLALSYLNLERTSDAIRILKPIASQAGMSVKLNLALAYVLNERVDMARALLNRTISTRTTETILTRFEAAYTRVKNGSSVSEEIANLTQSPFGLKEAQS